jgi:hypothetical protein
MILIEIKNISQYNNSTVVVMITQTKVKLKMENRMGLVYSDVLIVPVTKEHTEMVNRMVMVGPEIRMERHMKETS